MSWFKVWSVNIEKRAVVSGLTVQDIIRKGSTSLGIEGKEIVLEEDGSKIFDDETISVMDKGTKLILLSEGETWKISTSVSEEAGGSKESIGKLTKEEIKVKLQNIRAKRVTNSPSQVHEPQKKRKQKETYQISFGWLQKDEQRNIKYVVPRRGGGAKKKDIPRLYGYDKILAEARKLYNIQPSVTAYLGKFDGSPLEKSLVCDTFVKESEFLTLPRIYVITNKGETNSSTSTESDIQPDDADEEDPEISFGKKDADSEPLDDTLPLNLPEKINYSDTPDEIVQLQITIAEEERSRDDARIERPFDVPKGDHVPVYSCSAVVQMFVDLQDATIKNIETGYGPFFLIPKSMMDAFDQFRDETSADSRYLHVLDGRLKYWSNLTKAKYSKITENVVSLSKEDDMDYQIFLESLL